MTMLVTENWSIKDKNSLQSADEEVHDERQSKTKTCCGYILRMGQNGVTRVR